MRYCIELSRPLNISRAAENRFVSQPTFSYQIKLLEEEVGFTIFERSGGTGRVPHPRIPERPQRAVRLDSLRLWGDLLLRALYPPG